MVALFVVLWQWRVSGDLYLSGGGRRLKTSPQTQKPYIERRMISKDTYKHVIVLQNPFPHESIT